MPLRGIGETPGEGFPTQKQSAGLFLLPILRLLTRWRFRPLRRASGAPPPHPAAF